MTTQDVMTAQEVANRFYELAQAGDWNRIQEELYSKDAKSIEPAGPDNLPTVQGLDKIKEKGKLWEEMIQEVHGGYCKEPQVAGDYFVCAMGVDATFKGQERNTMHEIALYKVEDGKIVSEQFFY